jgi:hypothetical protein
MVQNLPGLVNCRGILELARCCRRSLPLEADRGLGLNGRGYLRALATLRNFHEARFMKVNFHEARASTLTREPQAAGGVRERGGRSPNPETLSSNL